MDYPVDHEFYLIRTSQSSFTTSLQIDASKKFTHIAVSSLSIPKTYYVLPNNCSLIINEGKNSYSFNFVAGNYSANSFMSIFNNNNNSGCAYTYTCTYPNKNSAVDTGLFTYTVTNNSGVQPSFYTSDIYLGNIMGFVQGTTYNFVGNNLVSATVLNFQSYDEIIITSNIVSNRMNLLQEVYANDSIYNSSINWINTNLPLNAKLLSGLCGNTFTFNLLDSEGGLIGLNGNEWSMVIVIFKIDNLSSVIKSYIDIELSKQRIEKIDLE